MIQNIPGSCCPSSKLPFKIWLVVGLADAPIRIKVTAAKMNKFFI
jgi:hypothetical protein